MVQRLLLGLVCVALGIGIIVWNIRRSGSGDTTDNVSGRDDVNTVCIQVLTHAKNPATGVAETFPTPCDVPEGWERVTAAP